MKRYVYDVSGFWERYDTIQDVACIGMTWLLEIKPEQRLESYNHEYTLTII